MSAELHIPPQRNESSPYIERHHYGGHYDAWTGSDIYPIPKEVVSELKSEGLVAGTPRWGYTDKYEFELTNAGEVFYWQVVHALEGLLAPFQMADKHFELIFYG